VYYHRSVLQGAYEITTPNAHGIAHVGELFLTAPGQPLTIIHHGDPNRGGIMKSRWIHINYWLHNAIDIASMLELPLIVSGCPAEQLGQLIQNIIDLETASCSPLQLSIELHSLAFRSLAVLAALAPLKPQGLALLSHSQLLVPVLMYIAQNLHRPISIDELAQQANLSRSRFFETFKHYLGISPLEYIRRQRLTQACRLLLQSDLSIKQIAAQLGYRNPFYFSRDFGKMIRMTPSDYRRRNPWQTL